MGSRQIVWALLKGVAITPLGGLIGTLTCLLTFGAGSRLADVEFVLAYGTVVGSLFAAPATIGIFPLLYAVWPQRTRRAFIYVMGLSALSGLVSPFVYMWQMDPRWMIMEPFHIILAATGMFSAMILAPLYFHWTRRPATIGVRP